MASTLKTVNLSSAQLTVAQQLILRRCKPARMVVAFCGQALAKDVVSEGVQDRAQTTINVPAIPARVAIAVLLRACPQAALGVIPMVRAGHAVPGTN